MCRALSPKEREAHWCRVEVRWTAEAFVAGWEMLGENGGALGVLASFFDEAGGFLGAGGA